MQRQVDFQSFFGRKKEQSYLIIDIYDYLMHEYGYIPFEDFKKMDAQLVNELVERINKRNEKQNQASKSRGRR